MANVPNQKKVNVNEYRDKIFYDLIDYAHNAKKGEIIYHPGFSPNNIKRVIISPDKVKVYYYVSKEEDRSIPLDTKTKTCGLAPQRIWEYSQQEGYEPLISALSYRLVTTSVQEIIFCMKASNNVPVELSPKEFDFTCLIKSYNNKGASVLETVKRRYKRLAYISVFNGSYADLMNIVSQNNYHGNFFTNNPAIKPACSKVIPLNDKDWFDNWGQNAAKADGTDGYQLDNNGSALNLLFKRVQEQAAKAKSKKEDGFEQYKKEKETVSESNEKTFESALKSYKNFAICGTKLLTLLQENGNSIYEPNNVNNQFTEVARVDLYENSAFTKDKAEPKYRINVVSNSNTDMKADDIARKNTEILKVKCQAIYECIATLLLTNITSGVNKYGKDMYLVALSDFDNVLKPTPGIESLVVTTNVQLGKNIFTGEKVKDAMANACYLISLLYLSKRTDTSVSEFLSKDYWYNKL